MDHGRLRSIDNDGSDSSSTGSSRQQLTIAHSDIDIEEEPIVTVELRRAMSALMSFSFAFTSVAVISSLTSLYPTAIANGGPVVVIWSWLGGSMLTISAGCSLAEISSTYPSSGSVYYWASVMAPKGYSPVLSYITGWFNVIGNSSSDAFYGFTFAAFTDKLLVIAGYPALSMNSQVAVGIFVMFLWAIANCATVEHQGIVNFVGSFWQLASTVCVIATLYVSCTLSTTIPHATVSQVLFTPYNGTGIQSYVYVVLIGTLSTFYSFTGYDAASHMAEETKDASKNVPQAIVWTCVGTAAIGLLYLISLTFQIANDVDAFVTADKGVFGIFQKCMNKNAIYLCLVILVNVFFSGMSSFTVTTRATYVLARDDGFPFASHVKHINKTTQIPLYSVLAVFLSGVVFLLIQLVSSTAFVAITSISTIGFQISYTIPIILRITCFRSAFIPADFSLGKYGVLCGCISAMFLVSTSVLFLLPVEWPITVTNFNYTPAVLICVAAIAGGYWMFFARFWFKGPRSEGDGLD